MGTPVFCHSPVIICFLALHSSLPSFQSISQSTRQRSLGGSAASATIRTITDAGIPRLQSSWLFVCSWPFGRRLWRRRLRSCSRAVLSRRGRRCSRCRSWRWRLNLLNIGSRHPSLAAGILGEPPTYVVSAVFLVFQVSQMGFHVPLFSFWTISIISPALTVSSLSLCPAKSYSTLA